MPAAILRFAYPKVCCRSLMLLHYARPPLEAIVAGSVTCSKQDDPGTTQVCVFTHLVSAEGHAKAERIFSNLKNIAFRPGLQADR